MVLRRLNSNSYFDTYQLCDSGQAIEPLCSLLFTVQTRHEAKVMQRTF